MELPQVKMRKKKKKEEWKSMVIEFCIKTNPK